MNRTILLPIAEDIAAMLEPACERVLIAGSLRRGKEDCHDAELVLQPARDINLLGEPTDGYPELDRRLHFQEIMKLDTEVKRNGPRLKRFRHCETGAIIELYIADEENFGALAFIRTGDAAWSRLAMTSRANGGLMPFGWRQRDGYLWHGEERISVPEESDFFSYIKVPWVDPCDRNVAKIGELRK